jgi:hypothetical protein
MQVTEVTIIRNLNEFAVYSEKNLMTDNETPSFLSFDFKTEIIPTLRLKVISLFVSIQFHSLKPNLMVNCSEHVNN